MEMSIAGVIFVFVTVVGVQVWRHPGHDAPHIHYGSHNGPSQPIGRMALPVFASTSTTSTPSSEMSSSPGWIRPM